MKLVLRVACFIMILVLALASPTSSSAQGTGKMEPMGGMKSMGNMKSMGGMGMVTDAPVVPAVSGFSEGQTILFIHTETSDPKIAKLLTDMMGGSPVLVVPELANVPANILARVYVFKNAGQGKAPKGPMGPFGFQPDVFESPPGTPGYSPLRKIVLVRWVAGAGGLLKSAAAVRKAAKEGKLKLEETNVVVNMPLLTWPGGKR